MKKELIDILFNRFEKEKEEIKKILSTSINGFVLQSRGKSGIIRMSIVYEENNDDEKNV